MADEDTTKDENTVTDTYHVPGAPYEDKEAAEATQEQQEEVEAGEAEKPDRPYVAFDSRTPALAYATKDNIVHPGPVGAAVAAQADAVLVSEDVFNVSSPLRVEFDPSQNAQLLYEPEDVDQEAAREVFEGEVEALVEARREGLAEG